VEELSDDCSTVRINAWECAEDLEKMELKDLHELIDEACELLSSEGCENISVLGKSFGGQLALTYPENNNSEKMVLCGLSNRFSREQCGKVEIYPA
jgi:esterase/lipase